MSSLYCFHLHKYFLGSYSWAFSAIFSTFVASNFRSTAFFHFHAVSIASLTAITSPLFCYLGCLRFLVPYYSKTVDTSFHIHIQHLSCLLYIFIFGLDVSASGTKINSFGVVAVRPSILVLGWQSLCCSIASFSVRSAAVQVHINFKHFWLWTIVVFILSRKCTALLTVISFFEIICYIFEYQPFPYMST